MWTRSGAVLPKPAGPPQTITDIPLYAVPGAMHPKPAGPLHTPKDIPLYAVPGPCTLNRQGRSKPYMVYETLNGRSLYADPGAVRPKSATGGARNRRRGWVAGRHVKSAGSGPGARDPGELVKTAGPGPAAIGTSGPRSPPRCGNK